MNNISKYAYMPMFFINLIHICVGNTFIPLYFFHFFLIIFSLSKQTDSSYLS